MRAVCVASSKGAASSEVDANVLCVCAHVDCDYAQCSTRVKRFFTIVRPSVMSAINPERETTKWLHIRMGLFLTT